jgi:hypothetical protein
VAPRVSGLANLSEYIDGMEKINSRQGKADDEDETGRLMAAFSNWRMLNDRCC